MKIDVEGMEANVIRGARDVIRHCRPVLYVENNRREKLLELIRLLQEMDYSLATVVQSQGLFPRARQRISGSHLHQYAVRTRWADRVAGGHLSDFEPRRLVERYLLACVTLGHRDKNILNMDLLRR